MKIAREEWAAASGSYVQDGCGRLWQIIGFIDQPAVILEPVESATEAARQHFERRERQVVIMGTPVSEEYARLVPEKAP